MKIDDAPLNHYLIKNLQPLTEADPTLLADYVAALLKNNKPKKELQKLCVDQLYDFLGEGTKIFVVNLFRALDYGTIPTVVEELEGTKQMDTTDIISSGAADSRLSPPHLERIPSNGPREWDDEIEEEESSDEDRNHKHRRRVSLSRSTDRIDEPDSVRFSGRVPSDLKRQGGDLDRVVSHFDRDRATRFERRVGRDHAAGRFNNGDDGRGMMRGGPPPFRGDAPGLGYDNMRVGRGRGAGGWAGPLPPPPFTDAPPPLLAPNAGFFPGGRGMAGRGPGWPGGFGPMAGMVSGPMELPHPGRGPPGGLHLGMGMGPIRPRCLDFEERGFCLRGDLCPMDHGSHIVVEDVQSLSKFNLPVTLSNGRGMSMGPAPMAVSQGTILPSLGRGNRGSREPSVPPLGEVSVGLNGPVGLSEPDSYDPDQPLWNKDRPEASARLRKLSSFQNEHPEQDWEGDKTGKPGDLRGAEGVSRGATNGSLHGSDPGSTVWDRIGPVDRSEEGSLMEEQRVQNRGASWQSGKFESEVEGAGPPHLHVNPGRGRGVTGWGEVGPPPHGRPKEGPSFGSRATPGRGAERAQRTLYVSCIPPTSNRAEILLMHFEKFGHVVDVRIPPHSDRAFVQFSTREEAELALASSDAVMGNRFIRLSWANRDSILSDNVASTSFTGNFPPNGAELAAGHSAHLLKGRGKMSLVSLNGVMNGVSGASISDGGGKTVTSNGFAPSLSTSGGATALKKQEELELMREKIRQKQEALAQKRDDFRRKLNKFANQGVGGLEETADDQPSKRQKLEDTGDSDAHKEIAVAGGASTISGLRKSSAGETLTQAGVTQLSSKPTRSHSRSSLGIVHGHPSSAAWGPARFKLDNRPSVFRILPPLPAAVSEISIVREHFSLFGELSTVKVEDAEGHQLDAGQPLTTNSYVRVTYTTRRSAERAMTQGRWFHGQTLNLAWASVSSANRSTEGPGPANNIPIAVEHEATNRSDANGQDEDVSIGADNQEEGFAASQDEAQQGLPWVGQQQPSVLVPYNADVISTLSPDKIVP